MPPRGVTLGSHWGHPARHPVVTLGPPWSHPGATLGSQWGHPGVTVGSPWGHSGVTVGSPWGPPTRGARSCSRLYLRAPSLPCLPCLRGVRSRPVLPSVPVGRAGLAPQPCRGLLSCPAASRVSYHRRAVPCRAVPGRAVPCHGMAEHRAATYKRGTPAANDNALWGLLWLCRLG